MRLGATIARSASEIVEQPKSIRDQSTGVEQPPACNQRSTSRELAHSGEALDVKPRDIEWRRGTGNNCGDALGGDRGEENPILPVSACVDHARQIRITTYHR